MFRPGSALGHFCWHFLSYHIQKAQLLASFWHRLLVLACVSLGCVTTGALMYYLVSGQPLLVCLVKSYGVMFRAPGFVVSNEPTLAASLVMNTMFIFSVFVFATLIGMIGDEVKQSIQAMRNGDVPLRLRGHTLVLNWNSLTLSLLRQLYHAQHDPKHCLYKRPVVVLADRPKSDMDALVCNAMKGFKFEVFLRSGRPSRQPDLQRVAAHAAGTVLLLQPEPCSSDTAAEALKATTLISLRCLQLTEAPSSWSFNTSLSPFHWAKTSWHYLANSMAQGCNNSRSNSGRGSVYSVGGRADAMCVVVQVPQLPRNDDLLGFLHNTTASVSNVEGARLLSQHMLDRLVAQTAVQPGIGQAFREMLRAGADAAQLCWCEVDDEFDGIRYRQACQMFHQAVMLGVLSATDGQLRLNSPDELMLAAGDRLLGFTRQAPLHPVSLDCSGNTNSSPWRYLGRPLSRATSMSSKNLHVIPSNSSFTAIDTDSTPRYQPPSAVKVIVLGWNEATVQNLLGSLQEAAPEGSCFTVIHQASTEHEQGQRKGQQSQHQDQSPGTVTAQQGLLWVEPPQQKDAQRQQQEDLQERYTVRHVHAAQPCSVTALTAAGIADADAVIIGGALAPTKGHHSACAAAGGLACNCESDAMVVAALLAVQQSLQQAVEREVQSNSSSQVQKGMKGIRPSTPQQIPKAERRQGYEQSEKDSISNASDRSTTTTRLHVVAMLSSYSVRRAAQLFLSSMLVRNFSYEIMVLDEYAAAMILQVAQDPATALVMDQLLLQPSGKALFMWPASVLGLHYGSMVSFSQISKAARNRSSTALGYRRASGSMLLAPLTDDVFVLHEGDRIVVIADSHEPASVNTSGCVSVRL